MAQQVRTLSMKSEFRSQNPGGGKRELTSAGCHLPSIHEPWHACNAFTLIQRSRETETEAYIDTKRQIYAKTCMAYSVAHSLIQKSVNGLFTAQRTLVIKQYLSAFSRKMPLPFLEYYQVRTNECGQTQRQPDTVR
jgi:hypothetical protein